jgi:hypothetical protein
MREFIAISLSTTRVPGRMLKVSGIGRLAKLRPADHPNVRVLRRWCAGQTAVADIAVKYSERTARNVATPT